MVYLPRIRPLKQASFLSSSRHKQPLAPACGWELCPSPQSTLGFGWRELAQVLCTLSQSLWVHKYNCSSMARNRVSIELSMVNDKIRKQSFLIVIYGQWLFQSFCPFLQQLSLSPWDHVCDTDVPYRAKYSSVFHLWPVLQDETHTWYCCSSQEPVARQLTHPKVFLGILKFV